MPDFTGFREKLLFCRLYTVMSSLYTVMEVFMATKAKQPLNFLLVDKRWGKPASVIVDQDLLRCFDRYFLEIARSRHDLESLAAGTAIGDLRPIQRICSYP
jgi:hypothetical protein